MNLYPVHTEYSAYIPHSEHNTFVAHPPISPGLVCPQPSPSQSDDLYDYFDDPGHPEDSFVSPVTYDPASGLYIQTFPEEHAEFLRKFGQHIDIPEPDDSYQGEWSYYDAQTSKAQFEQPSGFYYNARSHSAPPEEHEASTSSLASNDDGTSMMQYMTSPALAATRVHHQYVDNTIAPAALYNSSNLPHYPQQATHEPSAPNPKVEEELIQPHMIVPSQHGLGGFMEELRRRELPVEIRSHRPLGDPLMNHLPFQDSLASSHTTITTQVPEELRQEQPWGTQMSDKVSGYPVHELHSVPPEVASPTVSSPESDDSHTHNHSYSPKPKHRTMSRSWSPHKRTPSPRAPSVGARLSPLPHNTKVSTDTDKRLTLACLFCRGRKIACGPPLPGSTDKSCNQCARRQLKCEYPTESRRGMRRRHKAANTDKGKAGKVVAKGPRKRATR